MPYPLKQSTETVVRMGPFVDATDGVTPETGVTLGAADQAEALKNTGGVVDISGATFAAIANCGGWYDLTLTTSHTDTLGMLTVVIQDSSVCLPVHKTFIVLPANVFDSTVSTDLLDVNIEQVEGQNVTSTAGVLNVNMASASAAAIAQNVIASAELNRIADFVLRREWDATVETIDSTTARDATIDTLSTTGKCLLGLLSMLVGKRGRSAAENGYLQLYKADLSTTWYYQTLATDETYEMITAVSALTAGTAP